MSVIKLFWVDPYLTETEAKIITINDDKITLDQTVAYAVSGGQDSDSGTIGEYEILAAEKQEDEIVYTLTREHSLSIGDNAIVKIDWEKRYRLMKLHFAVEVLISSTQEKSENCA